MRPFWSFLLLSAGCWPYIGSGGPSLEADAEADADTDADSDSDSDSDADSDTEPQSVCSDGPLRTGPWLRHPLDAVELASDPLANDAGIDAVLQAILGAASPTPVELRVQGAVITATVPAAAAASGRVTFWASDRSGTVVGWQLPVDFDPSTLGPGDIVDLRVSEVHDFFGVPEVTEAQVEIVGQGGSVFVTQSTGERLDYGRLAQEEVEVWGKLVAGPEGCGEADCFELDHGAAKDVSLRIAPGKVELGDCVHVIAPLDVFEDEPQLGIENLDWLRTF